MTEKSRVLALRLPLDLISALELKRIDLIASIKNYLQELYKDQWNVPFISCETAQEIINSCHVWDEEGSYNES